MDRLPGFRDFFPEPLPDGEAWSAEVREYIFECWHSVARRYAFRLYDGPPLELLDLYTAKSGEEIVGQLYNFIDKGERNVSLRPEMTPTVARMVAARERHYKKPIKWYSVPQLFRYERQQKGRLREHFQFNADIFGENDPAADAELIALLIDLLRNFNLSAEDFVIRLSSRNAWQEFFATKCSDESKAYNFYQTVDKLERAKPEESDKKFKILGFSLGEVRGFIDSGEPTQELQAVLDNLAARGLSDYVKIDYNVIRGLAYYTGIVFEAFDRHGKFRAIAGGGRYDQLVSLVSGGKNDIPGAGFAMGDVVLTELLKERGLLPEFKGGIEVYALIEDELLRDSTISLVQSLRKESLNVDYSIVPLKPDKQFKRALEHGVQFTVRLEDQAIAKVKNLKTRDEQTLPTGEVAAYLMKAVSKLV
ncbi:MAG: ATP phosphoribosyltransferase regulatory subunit [Verrucomicrobiota bacterium]|jgi:histidyl-tRNA synthetase|nr:ATP phosphoribosyltransferase regulatory subunit [Verrucomicrobiota bacterium]